MASQSVAESPGGQARRLLRAARVGCLATSAQGQPFASLVTPACMPDGSLLLLLSRLSEHTRHLAADSRCSVMVSGIAETANPQTTPRATVTGLAEVVDDPALKARYLAVHPYASLYADFSDFATWRIKPAGGLLVAGFGKAARLKAIDFGSRRRAQQRRFWRRKKGFCCTATATTPTPWPRSPGRSGIGGWSPRMWTALIWRQARGSSVSPGPNRWRPLAMCAGSWCA